MKEEKKEVVKESKESFFKSRLFLMMVSFIVGAILMFILIFLTTNTPIFVQRVTSENVKTTTLEEMSDLKTAINSMYDATVYIESTGSRTQSAGSGFIYKKDGNNAYILTNYHVIEGGSKYTVTLTTGEELSATLLGGDQYYDIAILKVVSNNIKRIVSLGNSDSVELGDTVFTVGAPLGKEYMGTVTKGIISGTKRMVPVELSSGNYLMEVIQTDAAINNGNSGGALCNIKGEVIGITSSKLIGSGVEGMGFALPINTIKELITNIESGSTIERPYLGVQLADINNTFALQYYYNIRISNDVTFGAVLSLVEDNMPAAKAGLKVGDVIVDIDGKKVDDVSHFKYILYKYKIGDKIKVKYYRENKLEETTIELTEKAKNN